MTATAAEIGYGITFAKGDGATPTEAFTALGEVFGSVPPSLSRETVDATHMLSANRVREHISGMRDSGEAEIELNYVPGGTAWDALKASYDSDDPINYKITFSNAATVIFPALITELTPTTPMADKMTLKAKFKLTGAPTWS
jgi:predicted secreted protein